MLGIELHCRADKPTRGGRKEKNGKGWWSSHPSCSSFLKEKKRNGERRKRRKKMFLLVKRRKKIVRSAMAELDCTGQLRGLKISYRKKKKKTFHTPSGPIWPQNAVASSFPCGYVRRCAFQRGENLLINKTFTFIFYF